MAHRTKPSLTFIRKLCAQLPEVEIQEAEERFWRYLEIARRIAIHHTEQHHNSGADDTPCRFDNPKI